MPHLNLRSVGRKFVGFVSSMVFALGANSAAAQTLAITPGNVSAITSTDSSNGSSPVNYAGAASGLSVTGGGQMTFDAAGNLFLVDQGRSAVRVIAAGNTPIPSLPGVTPQAGQVYTVAGSGNTSPGTSPLCGGGDVLGNGCSASLAVFSFAYSGSSIAVDAAGNLYIADSGDNQVRVVYGGKTAPVGLPSNLVAGNIYAFANASATPSPNPGTGDGGSALTAELSGPSGLSIDPSGNIYILDNGNSSGTIRVVYGGVTLPPGFANGTAAGTINTVVGPNTVLPTLPYTVYGISVSAMASDPAGNVYFVQSAYGSGAVVLVNYVSGTVPGVTNPVAGSVYYVAGNGANSQAGPYGGSATAATIFAVASLKFDAAGDLYIVDNGGPGLIDKIDRSGTITLVAGDTNSGGTGPGSSCSASDGYGDGCVATQQALSSPGAVAIAPDGSIYYSDSNLIHKIDVSASAPVFTQTAGLSTSQTLLLSNDGTAPLQLTSLDVPAGPFQQASASGTSACSASTLLAPGTACSLGITYAPPAIGNSSASITIGSNSTNAASGVNTITPAGIATGATASTSLSIYPATANSSQPVTLTATLTPQFGETIAPTGTVTFKNGTTTVGTGAVTNNVATLTTSSLPVGNYSIMASYGGDTLYAAAASFPAPLTISATPVPTVTVTASAASANANQSVTLTATVAAYIGSNKPTGTVTFLDGNGTIGTATLNGAGVATLSTATLPVGQNTIYAAYGGDSNFVANTSSGVSVTIRANAMLTIAPGEISTVAGQFGTPGSFGAPGGSGYPPTLSSAGLSSITGITTDPGGNIYLADGFDAEVLVIPSGRGSIPGATNSMIGGYTIDPQHVYVIAGAHNGQYCQPDSNGVINCGEGGAALNGIFQSLGGIWADAFGDLYISDNGYSVVYKINPAGTLIRVAGTLNPPSTPLPNFGDGGLATNATLSNPKGIVTDNVGNLYIADNGTGLVRRVDAITGVISTVAGSQTLGPGFSGDGGAAINAQLNGPSDLKLDASGNLYIVDTGNNVIRRVDAKTSAIATVAGSQVAGAGYSGDGGPATSAQLNNASGVAVDPAGDLYIGDSNNNVVRFVSAQTGVISTVAGVANMTGTSGDGGQATQGNLNGPQNLAFSAEGDLLITDSGDDVIRKVTAGTSIASFGNPGLGSTNTQVFTLTSTGQQPLDLSGITFPAGFLQQSTGAATDCALPQALAPSASCQLTIEFFPTAATSFSGNVAVATTSNNAISGQNTIAVSGTGTSNGGTTAQTITFTPPATATYGTPVQLNAAASSGLPVVYLASGPGRVSGSTLTPTGVGTITVTAYQFGDAPNTVPGQPGFAAAQSVSANIVVAPAPLTVTADNQSRAPGLANPALTYTITGFVDGDTQASVTTGAPVLATTATAASPTGNYPITIQQGTLQITSPNYTFTGASFVAGSLTVTQGLPQTITFPTLPNTAHLVYGALPIALQATTSAPGLQVVYTVTGPAAVTGSILTITGAGAVAVTATQPGDATYQAAQPVTQSFNVTPAPLTFTATNLTLAQGAALPALTYTVSGLVNGDTAANVVTGTPVLSTTATSASPAGTVAPITIMQGSVTVSPNYSISASSFLPGTLTIVAGTSQTIAFNPLPGLTYGAQPFTLNAVASSGLPVTYTATGPAVVVNNTLSITGAGTVTVTASQGGNGSFGAAMAQQSFTVAPAALTVTANNVTRVNDTQNPAFTYTITGFVNGDTAAVVSGSVNFSTTAAPGSPAGTYPIDVSNNNLTASNYTFANFVPGTLTITSGGPVADFTPTLTPQQMTILSGGFQQTTITLTSVNFYQGLVNLSCQPPLPANVTCIFTPAAIQVPPQNGNIVGTVTGTLTINTGSSPLVSSIAHPAESNQATIAWWSALLFGFVLACQRKRLGRYGSLGRALLPVLLLAGMLGIAACGSSTNTNTNNGNAAPGTSTIQVVMNDATGGPSHSLNLVVTVR